MLTAISVAIALVCTYTYNSNRQRPTIGLIAAIGWLMLSFAAYQNSIKTWDAYYILFIVSIFICGAVVYEVGDNWNNSSKNAVPKEEKKEKETDNNENSSGSYEHPMDVKRRGMNLPPIHDRESREDRKFKRGI